MKQKVSLLIMLMVVFQVTSGWAKEAPAQKTTKSATPSLEMLEFLADFSDDDGAVIDPQTLKVLARPAIKEPSLSENCTRTEIPIKNLGALNPKTPTVVYHCKSDQPPAMSSTTTKAPTKDPQTPLSGGQHE